MELWNDLQIPLHNWEQLNITGDFKWLLKKWTEEKIEFEKVEAAYFSLHDAYSDSQKDNDRIEKWRVLVIQRMEARAEYAAGDRSQLNQINKFSAMIEMLMSDNLDVDVIKNRLIIQQAYGMPIKPTETTLAEFMKITEIVSEQSARTNKNTNGED